MLEKNKGEVLSGESIAGELGCTRAAVWKAVKSLREEGYHIEAGPNKGYMLAKDTNRLSQEGIRLFLDDPKVKVDIYDELESTNQTAKKEAMMGEAGHGAFVIARSQTAGRGRRGREFYSPADTGLYMSVILKPLCCLSLRTAGWLMDHDSGMRKSKSLSFCTACQKKGTHAGSHSKTNGRNIAFNILHGIIDCHAGCYGTARAVDIQLNIFTRIFCFQEKKL